MKLLHAKKEHYVFELSNAEKELLTLILGLYPVIPPAHHRLSKNSDDADLARQQLLDESLAEQRRENKELLATFLADQKRFVKTTKSHRLSLSPPEIEWLLQILNDVRVGNWILLGSPENEMPVVSPDAPDAPRALAMELAGLFQNGFLDALHKTREGDG